MRHRQGVTTSAVISYGILAPVLLPLLDYGMETDHHVRVIYYGPVTHSRV